MPNYIPPPDQDTMAQAGVLRWYGKQPYQPDYQHPLAHPPNPERGPTYEDQLKPPAQQARGLGLQLPGQGQGAGGSSQPQQQIPGQGGQGERDTFMETMQIFKEMRRSGRMRI